MWTHDNCYAFNIMNCFRSTYITFAVLACMATAGCGESTDVALPTPESTPIVTNSVITPEASEGAPAITEATAATTLVESDSEASSIAPTSADGEEVPPAVAEYQAPFPDRADLFVPPKRQGGVVLKEGGSEEAVELLGFVRLDRQEVILSINGQVTPIAEGSTQHGIEVISIQPPKVVLQRGRQRWQASLEN